MNLVEDESEIVGTKGLSILILNWNRSEDTSDLILNIISEAGTEYRDQFEVIILDNGSEESIPSWWQTESKIQLTVLRSKTNLGYSGGMRYLAEHASREHLWFLNNDARLLPGSLRSALKVASLNLQRITLPIVFNPDRSIQSHDCHWHPILTWRQRPVLSTSPEVPYRLFGDIFVGPLMPFRLWEHLGLFPTEFHTYGEDVDACLAAAVAAVPLERDNTIQLSHAKSSSKPEDLSYRFQLDCQGVRNSIASALINYQLRHFWSIPLLISFLMFRELLWRRRYGLHTKGGVWRWLMTPPRAISLAWRLRALRKHRQSIRQSQDSAIWSFRASELP